MTRNYHELTYPLSLILNDNNKNNKAKIEYDSFITERLQ